MKNSSLDKKRRNNRPVKSKFTNVFLEEEDDDVAEAFLLERSKLYHT